METILKEDHKIKAILFDLDGVLVDGAPWHRESMLRALHDFGWDVNENEIVNLEGLTTIDKLAELSRRGRVGSRTGLHEKINELKQNYMLEIIENRCVRHTPTFNAVCYADLQLPCAVVTNCSKDAAHLMLEKSNLKQFMGAIITNEDVPDGKAKPHPLPYSTGAWRLGFQTKQCLAFDDTDKGIMSALEAGCKFHRIRQFGDLTRDIIHRKLKSLRIRL